MPRDKARKQSKNRDRLSPAVGRIKPAHPGRNSKRTCGDCTACCSAMAVPALRKPAFSACPTLNTPESAPHAKPGCGDYQNRPEACRSFRCAWLEGFPMTGPGERPDRLGLILIPTVDPQVIQAREVWPNAGAESRAQDFITELRRAGLRVELVTREEQRTLQPLTIFGRPTPMVRVDGPSRVLR